MENPLSISLQCEGLSLWGWWPWQWEPRVLQCEGWNRGKEVQSGFEKLGEWMQLPYPWEAADTLHPHYRCSHWVEAVPAGVRACWLRVLSTVLRSACREWTQEDELYHWLSKQVVKKHPKKLVMWRSVKNSQEWCSSVVPTFTSELGMLHSTRIDNSSSSTWKRQSVYASQIPPRG